MPGSRTRSSPKKDLCVRACSAMAAMLVAALAVPEAFGADAVLFGVAYLIVRLLQLQLFAIAGKRDPDLLRAVLRMLPPATHRAHASQRALAVRSRPTPSSGDRASEPNMRPVKTPTRPTSESRTESNRASAAVTVRPSTLPARRAASATRAPAGKPLRSSDRAGPPGRGRALRKRTRARRSNRRSGRTRRRTSRRSP